MRRLAVILSGVAILAGSTLSAAYLLVSANSLITQIADGIERSTGRIVTINPGALIRRRAEINEIKLINPVVNLVVDAQGRGNWETGKASRTAKDITSPAVPP